MTRPSQDSYYGRPILKEPVWKPEVGWYLFTGGLAGASASLSLAARLSGNRSLARTSSLVAAAAVNVSPLLLIMDLGRPERFLNMLRVFKPTSPMSVGSWLLAATGTAQSAATTCELLDVLPRLGGGAQLCSGLLGPGLATYTAALLADTAVPIWHEARRELPAVFASSSCASAGSAAVLMGHDDSTGPARRLAIAGAGAELLATRIMERRLGMLAEPYRQGPAGRQARAARTATAIGLAATAIGRGRIRRAGAALILGGAVLQRFAVFNAGKVSARDPRYTVEQQRTRRTGRAGSREDDVTPDGRARISPACLVSSGSCWATSASSSGSSRNPSWSPNGWRDTTCPISLTGQSSSSGRPPGPAVQAMPASLSVSSPV